MKIIELKETITASNDKDAEVLRAKLKKIGVMLINLMASPGAGKTTLLERTIKALKDDLKIGILEADVDGDVDAKRVQMAGAKAIQVHTGGMCHMDAGMTEAGLEALGYDDLDLIFLENVGNLICPAEFDTGAAKKVMILSTPEGDDKPLKYPLMFEISDVVLINKCDTLSVFNDFDTEKVVERIKMRNPKADIYFISAKTGEGIDEWCDWLRKQVAAIK